MAHEIHIKPVLNGFVVRCGCQEVVFPNLSTMTNEIFRYYADPEAVEKEYRANAVNKPMVGTTVALGVSQQYEAMSAQAIGAGLLRA